MFDAFRLRKGIKLKRILYLSKYYAMETYVGVEVLAPCILNPRTRWSIARWSSLLDRFTSGAKIPRYPLNRRLGGSQSRSGRTCRESKTVRPAPSLYWLSYSGSSSKTQGAWLHVFLASEPDEGEGSVVWLFNVGWSRTVE